MKRLAPSVLSADFSKLGEEIERVEKAGADFLHLDVMDGMFVPNISFGPDIIGSVRKKSGLVFYVHLMIENPGRYIARFAACGADIITIHYESCDNQKEVLEMIREAGKIPSISIKPATPAFVLESLLPYVKMVLVMTVEPGFGGQKFMPDTMESVRALHGMISAGGYSIDIEVDGGIGKETAAIAAAAGANVFVAGSSIFKASDAEKAISDIRAAASQCSLA